MRSIYAICLLVTFNAVAGVVLKYDNASIFLDGKKMRAETEDSNVIFRSDKKLFWMIDTKKKNYYEMTKKQLKNTGKKISGAMAQLEKQLANMPPAQRKMMRKMMKGQMGAMGGSPKKIAPMKYKLIKSGVKIGKWKAKHYEGKRSGKVVSELWTVPMDELDLKKSDLKVFKEMSSIFDELKKSLPKNMMGYQMPDISLSQMNKGFDGFPVKALSRGKETQVTELKEVKRQSLDSKLFTVPKGYAKKKTPGM